MRLRAKVEELTDRAEIAKHLKLDFPVPTATMSAKRIEAEINFSIDRRVEDRFAGALTTQLEQEAIEKFPLAEIGDDVEAVDIRRGIVTGKLLRNHPAYVDVGGRRVSKVDLSKESMAFFDEDANLQIRERHVRRQLQAQRNRKHEITIEMRKTLSKEMYLANNYVRYKGKWITATEMMDIAVKYRRKKLVKKYSKAIQGEVYSEHDYVKQDGVWIKPDEIPIVDIKIPTNDILPDQPPTGGNGPDEVVPPWEQVPPPATPDPPPQENVPPWELPDAPAPPPVEPAQPDDPLGFKPPPNFRQTGAFTPVPAEIFEKLDEEPEDKRPVVDDFWQDRADLEKKPDGGGAAAAITDVEGAYDVDDFEMYDEELWDEDEDDMGFLFWVVLYAGLVVVSTGSLFVTGLIINVNVPLLSCLAISAITQLVRLVCPFFQHIVTFAVTYGLLYKWTDADSDTDLWLMVVISNVLCWVSFIVILL